MKITDTLQRELSVRVRSAGAFLNCLFAHPAPLLSVGDQEAQTERMEAMGRQKKHHVSSLNKNKNSNAKKV